MQLRHYFAILRRFWLPIVLLPLLVGALSLFLAMSEPQRYGAAASLIITQTPRQDAATAPFPDVNLNYSWASSEYIIDDLPQIVSSEVFATDASALAAEQGYTVSPGDVQSGIEVSNLHRSVTLNANAATPETAVGVLLGAIDALQTNGIQYWNRPTNGDDLSIAVLDYPTDAVPLNSQRSMVIDVGLRVALALAAAVGLAFLLHYLDDRLREARHVEEWTELPVVGVIPKE